MQLIPIDFNNLESPVAFSKSLKNIGFAVIKNHPIDYNLVQEVFQEWAIFFASETKNKYKFNPTTQDGFFPTNVSETAVGNTVKDLKEFYHYYPWGRYPEELSNKTKDLFEQMNLLASTLLNWIEENLPAEIRSTLSEPLSNMIKDTSQTLMRVLHYPPLLGNENDDAVRAGAHTDINLITILVAASQAGLQVKDNNGNWLEVPVSPGMIAVNVGDMLQLATNNYYKSTMHQVVNPSNISQNNSRYSIPLFLHPRPEVLLTPNITSGEFLHQRLVEIGLKSA